MKKLKSIVAVLAAAATCIACGGTVSFAGSDAVSATYDPCDVNRDGAVNIVDVVTINSYLMGDLYSSDYNVFDANRSLTIDSADSDCIMSKVAMLSYSGAYISKTTGKEVAFPTVSGFIPDSAASTTAARKYMRYSYTDKKQLSDYTLYPASKANSSISTTAIVDGNDSRLPSYSEEDTGIVKLSTGTGFIVGDHQIATAAHCVYKKDNNSWYSMGITTYDSNGFLTSTKLTPVEAHIPSAYISFDPNDDKKEDNYYDYALITVKEDLSDYVHFDLGESYNITQSDFEKVPICVTGCPDEVNNSNNSNQRLYWGEGNVYKQGDNTSVLRYNTDATSGDSGSPVYTITKNNINGKESYTYTALAIHHGSRGTSYNYGALITKYQLQFYRNNTYASY